MVQPLVYRLDGKHYNYDGLCSMLKHSIAAANESRAASGQPKIASFGFRDLKGKGATDACLEGVPVEKIQMLIGHKSRLTTAIYIKQR